MSHHGKEMLALSDLISSIKFSPQELRRLRFEADEGLTRQSEANEWCVTRRWLKWIDRNTFHELPSRATSRYGGVSRPEYEESDELKPWMKSEMDALKRELKETINEKEKRGGMGTKWNDDNDQYEADDDDDDFAPPHRPHPKPKVDENNELKSWITEELEQVKKELQGGVMEGKCRCSEKKVDVGTKGDQGRSSATALAETTA